MRQVSLNSIQHAMQMRSLGSMSETLISHKAHMIFSKSLAVVISGVITCGQAANATMPAGMEIFEGMEEVTDSELGDMRGKFVSNNQILYFGVEMVSHWQTEMGTMVTASANLNIDFQAGMNGSPFVSYVPTVSIVQQGQQASQPKNDGDSYVSGGSGLANVSGVSQSIQVAGKSNSILNGINMQVSFAAPDRIHRQLGELSQHTGTLAASGEDGTLATVSLGTNSLGLSIAILGQGEVLQQIRNQGMFQSARIGGDLNQIHNAITMHIGINAGLGGAANGVGSALQSIMEMQQNGMF